MKKGTRGRISRSHAELVRKPTQNLTRTTKWPRVHIKDFDFHSEMCTHQRVLNRGTTWSTIVVPDHSGCCVEKRLPRFSQLGGDYASHVRDNFSQLKRGRGW